MMRAKRNFHVVPGFGLSLGYTLFWLGLIVLIPLAGLAVKASGLGFSGFWHVATSPRALASYRLSFGASFIAASVNVFVGSLIAWVLVRYRFFGRRFFDAIIDLPFALPTAVAGISLTAIYSENGILGRFFYAHGIETAYSPIGITIALIFIGLPFIVRTVQPVLEELDSEIEQAAATLGANRWTTCRCVIFPEVLPALLTGFALAFARAIGEYGSVVFIAGNLPMKTEITPLLIMHKLEEFDYRGATALAVAMLLISFLLLLVINLLQRLTTNSRTIR